MTSNWFLFLSSRLRLLGHDGDHIKRRKYLIDALSSLAPARLLSAVGCRCTPSLWVIASDANNTYNWLNNGIFSPIILPLSGSNWQPVFGVIKSDLDRLLAKKNTKMRLSHSNNHFIIFNERVERPPSRFSTTSRSRMLKPIYIIKESAKNNIFEHINEFMIVFTWQMLLFFISSE